MATIEVGKGSSLRRSDVIDICLQADVYILSISRRGASALERQNELEAELQIVRAEGPDIISSRTIKHPHTAASLQLLARIREALGADTTTKLPAGDARLVDTVRLIHRHLELVDAHGVELPEVSKVELVERFDWRGDTFAAGARLTHSELFQFYRTSFRQIAADALKASKGTIDERAKTQFDALRALSTSLEKSLDLTVQRKR